MANLFGNIDQFGSYPNVPGSKVSGTSQEAAESLNSLAVTLRRRVLALLQGECLTSDECAERLFESVLSIRPRLSELKAMDLIRDIHTTARFPLAFSRRAPVKFSFEE